MNIDKRNGSYSKTRKTKDRKENTLYTLYTNNRQCQYMSLYNIWYRKFLRSWLDCETGSEKL